VTVEQSGQIPVVLSPRDHGVRPSSAPGWRDRPTRSPSGRSPVAAGRRSVPARSLNGPGRGPGPRPTAGCGRSGCGRRRPVPRVIRAAGQARRPEIRAGRDRAMRAGRTGGSPAGRADCCRRAGRERDVGRVPPGGDRPDEGGGRGSAGREMSSFRWDGNACAVTVSDNHGFSLWPGFPVRSTDPRARKMAKRSGLPRLSDALEGKDAVPPLLAAWR
jgi:hypothetical protein